MKSIYENVKMEIVAFEAEDVITTSGGLGDLVQDEDTFNGGAIH